MRRKGIIYSTVLGGALVGSAFFIGVNLADSYDQQNTHPALTSEAVNFYNLNFPDNSLSENDKKWLIQGAIDEDTPPRWFNHFYDPVHNEGWLGYTSSKIWAHSSNKQVAFMNTDSQIAGFARLFYKRDLYPDDYSYQRALYDYAVGDRKRAMIAMGHVMHLLEDANVPEHTRGDTHLPFPTTESPYEKEMAKWTPYNVNIAQPLYKQSTKPVLLNNLDTYFNKIADYSNNYFFSEDTIFSERFTAPNIDFWKYQNINGKLIAFGYKKDNGGSYILVKKLDKPQLRNLTDARNYTVNDGLILNNYWPRLSKDFVVNGAGALKLFLDQAEKVKKNYVKNPQVTQVTDAGDGFWGFFGLANQNQPRLKFIPEVIDSTLAMADIVSDDVSAPQKLPLSSLSPSSMPLTSLTPLSSSPTPPPTPSITPLPVRTPSASPTKSPTPTPSISATAGGSSGSGGGGSQSASASTPTPSPSSSPTPSVSPSSSPTPSPSPSSTPEPSGTPRPPETSRRSVVINEIAWMGTGNTATVSNDEWIELYNPASASVDISGWTLKSLTDNSPDISIAASKTISPFGFFLLERTNDNTVSDISADQIYTGNLGDDGEALELRDSGGNLQDLVGNPASSSSPWYAGDKNNRASMERIVPTGAGNDPANWATNNGIIRNGLNALNEPINGTPKAKNSASQTTTQNQQPAAITDLTVDSSSFFGKVKLTWSAPTDDSPRADLRYDLRYATRSFDTLADWENSAKVASSSLPAIGESGSSQNSSFSIWDYNADYYFAVKTSDGAGWSEISNVPKYSIKPAISDAIAFSGPSNPSISWQFKPPTSEYIKQPAIDRNGTIIFGAGDNNRPKLYAVGQDGNEKWHRDEPADPSTPTIADDNSVYFGNSSNPAGVNVIDGDQSVRWRFNLGDMVPGVTLDADGDTLFTGVGIIYKFKPNGEQKWNISNPYINGFSPLAGPDGDIFMGADNGLPQFYRLKGDDGSIVWSTRAKDEGRLQFDPVFSENKRKLYAATDKGQIITLDADNGDISADYVNWHGRATTKVAVLSNSLVVALDFSLENPASSSVVYGVNKGNMKIQWAFPVDSWVNKQIIVDKNDNLYFSTQSGQVYGLDKNGQKRWVINLGSKTDSYPVLWDNAVFAAAGGKLFKIGD